MSNYLIADPTDSDDINSRIKYIEEITIYVPLGRNEMILSMMVNKDVLDIGFVEHNRKYIESEEWFHKKIKHICKNLTGADLNKNLVDELKADGYVSHVVDVCSGTTLGSKFDVIHAGDLIEHLHNLEGFFGFIERHLNRDGKLIISTPTPFGRSIFHQFFKYGFDTPNLEHTCWITPFNIFELCRRFNFKLEARLFPIKRKNGSIAYSYALSRLFFCKRLYEIFTGENVFVISKIECEKKN